MKRKSFSKYHKFIGLISAAADTGSSPVPATKTTPRAWFFTFMDFVVYILASDKTDKLYKGMTSNLIERFKSHNHMSTKSWTIKYRPWRVVYAKFFDTKKEALDHEKWLKTGVGREYRKSKVERK